LRKNDYIRAREGSYFRPAASEHGYCSIHRSTILEIHTGLIDRGAGLKWVSQFAHEDEHTLLPLSNFEIIGMRREDCCNVLEADLNLNLHAQTLEQMRETRQRMCLDFARKLAEEARQLVSGSPVIPSRKIEAETNLLLERIRSPALAREIGLDAVDYFNTPSFRTALNELFDSWHDMLSRAVGMFVAHAEALLADYHACLDTRKPEWLAGEPAREMESVLFQGKKILDRIKGAGGPSQPHQLALERIYDLLAWLLPKKPPGHANEHDYVAMLADRGKALATCVNVDYDKALEAFEDLLKFESFESAWERAKQYKQKASLLERRGASAAACPDDFAKALEAYQASLAALQEGEQQDALDVRAELFALDVEERVGRLLVRLGHRSAGLRKVETALEGKLRVVDPLKGMDDPLITDTLEYLHEQAKEGRGAGHAQPAKEGRGAGHAQPTSSEPSAQPIESCTQEARMGDEVIVAVFNILMRNPPDAVCAPHQVETFMRDKEQSSNAIIWGAICIEALRPRHEAYFYECADSVIQTITTGMVAHQHNAVLQAAACSALAAILEPICRDSEAMSAQATLLQARNPPLDVVLMALDLHDNLGVRREGVRVVRLLVCDSSTRRNGAEGSGWAEEPLRVPREALQRQGAAKDMMLDMPESAILKRALLNG